MVRLLGFFVPCLACVICLICVYRIQQRGKASRTERSTSCREPQANSASSTTVEKSSSRASGKRTKPLTVLPDSSLATSSCGKLRMATTFARSTSCRARRALRLSSSFLIVRRKASSSDCSPSDLPTNRARLPASSTPPGRSFGSYMSPQASARDVTSARRSAQPPSTFLCLPV